MGVVCGVGGVGGGVSGVGGGVSGVSGGVSGYILDRYILDGTYLIHH